MQRTTATKASQFLQKLSRQKPYWDQARLSSLVNEQVGRRGAGHHGAGTGSYGAGHRGAGHSGAGRQHCSSLVTEVLSASLLSGLTLQQSDF